MVKCVNWHDLQTHSLLVLRAWQCFFRFQVAAAIQVTVFIFHALLSLIKTSIAAACMSCQQVGYKKVLG